SAHLRGRALALAGRLDDSERQLARALELSGERGPAAVAIALDLGATAVEAGRPERAAAALEPYLSGGDGRVLVAYVSARRALAARLLEAGHAARAVTELERAERALPPDRRELTAAVRCELAVAATSARQHARALRALRALGRAGDRCSFPEPSLAVLAAINEGMESGAREALPRLLRLRRNAQGTVAAIARAGVAVLAMRAAAAAYERGNARAARQHLR